MARATLVAMNRCRAAELVAEAALRGALNGARRAAGLPEQDLEIDFYDLVDAGLAEEGDVLPMITFYMALQADLGDCDVEKAAWRLAKLLEILTGALAHGCW